MRPCEFCQVATENPRFCSLSCSVKDQRSRQPWPIGYCEECSSVFNKRGRDSKSKFCSRSCSASHNNRFSQSPKRSDKRGIEPCPVCGVEKKRNSTKTCSPECGREIKYIQYIELWKSGVESGHNSAQNLSGYVKRYLIELQDGKCALCQRSRWTNDIYDGPIVLEGDHINGNSSDSSPENVRMVCPTCHSTTPTYRGKNRGSGRPRHVRPNWG